MSKGMKATSMRNFLSVLMAVIILAAVAGFYYGLEQVRTFAVEVSHTTTDAKASGEAVEKLQELKQSLADSSSLVKKADQLFIAPANYQSQALKDIQRYASRTGVTIDKTDFANNTSTATSRTFSLSLKSPVEYKNLLHFLDALEGNLPKMQISSITLSRADSHNADEVNVDDIKITIATK